MTKLPPLKSREVVKGLKALGFEKVRQKGSHAIFHHQDCRRAPVPIHPTQEISPYFLSDILKQLEIEESEFLIALGFKK
ncbi:MAG: type II toxin-antitoxin system HicA family toxin [Dehalococcoidales bacterium]